MAFYDLHKDSIEVERSFINKIVNTNTRIDAITSNTTSTTEVPAATLTSNETQAESNIPMDEVLCEYNDDVSTGSADISVEEALAL